MKPAGTIMSTQTVENETLGSRSTNYFNHKPSKIIKQPVKKSLLTVNIIKKNEITVKDHMKYQSVVPGRISHA